MNIEQIHKRIDFINSHGLDQRIAHLNELFKIASDYISKKNYEDELGIKILDCISGMRTSRFIESDNDLKLLDSSLLIARTLDNPIKTIRQLISDKLYYSALLSDNIKLELQDELKKLADTRT